MTRAQSLRYMLRVRIWDRILTMKAGMLIRGSVPREIGCQHCGLVICEDCQFDPESYEVGPEFVSTGRVNGGVA